MRGLIIIVFIFLFLGILILNNNHIECYGENSYIPIDVNKSDNEATIFINKIKLKDDLIKMEQIINCIDCKIERSVCNLDYEKLFGKLESDLSFYEMVCILMESYVDNFLNTYLYNSLNISRLYNIIF